MSEVESTITLFEGIKTSRVEWAITLFEGQAEDVKEKCWQSHHLMAELWFMRYLFLSMDTPTMIM